MKQKELKCGSLTYKVAPTTQLKQSGDSTPLKIIESLHQHDSATVVHDHMGRQCKRQVLLNPTRKYKKKLFLRKKKEMTWICNSILSLLCRKHYKLEYVTPQDWEKFRCALLYIQPYTVSSYKSSTNKGSTKCIIFEVHSEGSTY